MIKKLLGIVVLSLLFSGSAYAYTYINCSLTHMKYKDSNEITKFEGSPGYMKFDKNLVFIRWDPIRKKFKVAESILKYDKYEIVFEFSNSSKIDGISDISTMTIDRISGEAKSVNSRRIHYYECQKISKSELPKKNASTKF